MNSSNEELFNKFATAANALTDFYNTAKEAQQESYVKGQKDALDGLIQHILQASGGDPRKLTTKKLLEHLENKMTEIQSSMPENNLPLTSPSVQTETPNLMDFVSSPSMNSYWQDKQNKEDSLNTNGQVLTSMFEGQSFFNNPGIFQNQTNMFGNNNSNPSMFNK